MRCDNRVEIKAGVETYCYLNDGHNGKCLAHPNIVAMHEKKKDNPKRCQAVNQGLICGLPMGHDWSHKNGYTSWS